MPFSATRDLWLVLKARDEATRALRGFSRDVRMVGDSVRQANLQASRSALINQMATQRLTGATSQQMLVTQRAIQENDRQIAGMRVGRAAAEEHRVAMQRLSSSMMGVAASAGAMGLALTASGVFGLRAMKGLINANIEYSKQAALTRTQVEGFVNSQKEIEDVGLRIARTIPVAFDEIQPALFDIFSSLEIGIKDAEVLLKQFSKASVAGQTEITKAGRSTIGILNAFQLPIKDVNHLLDLQFQLVQEGLGTYEEWAGRIGLVTPSAVRFGQTVEMMTAALAAATRMGIPAARSATAVSRAMDAMSHPRSVKALKELGINALDAKGKFRPMIDVMAEFRQILMKMPQSERISKILDVFKGAGGTIEARRFLQNMLLTPGNLELFKTIFTEMSEESGSFEQAYSIMADTTFAKTQILSNQWEALKVMAGEALAPAFLIVVGAISRLVEWFNNLDPGMKKVITTTLAIGLAVSTFAGILLFGVGILASFVAAFAVAGSSLLVVLGIMGGLTVAFGLFITSIVMAWKKSQGFRDIIGDISEQLKTLWQTYIVPTGLAIRDAWRQHMQPAFSKLAEIISTKVMPVVKDFISFITSEGIIAFKEVGNLVKDALVKAFEIISMVIRNVVVPAFEYAAKFYREHEETIKQITRVVIELGKWGVLLLGLFLVPLIGALVAVGAAIALVIAVFAGFVIAIVHIVDWVKIAIKWLGTNIPAALGFMKDVFKTVTGFIANVWSQFWNSSIMGLVKSVFGLILSIVKLSTTILVGIFSVSLAFIKHIWNSTWGAVKNAVVTIWNSIQGFLRGIWDAIFKLATAIWGKIKSSIGTQVSGVRDVVMTHINKIRDFFAGAGSWLFNAGKNLIDGLIRGITSKIKDLTGKIDEVTAKIRGFFPSSPAKFGPLSGRGSPFILGQNISKMLADGMEKGMRTVSIASGRVAAGVGTSNIVPTGRDSAGKTVNQSITINTQEINPRRQSEELGWLFAGRT